MASTEQDGEAMAFLARHRAAVEWALNRVGMPDSDRDDVRQEVALRVLDLFRRRGGPKPGNHHALLCRLALNTCMDHYRRRPPVAVPLDKMRIQDPMPGPLEVLAKRQEHDNLHRAVLRLPSYQKTIMGMALQDRDNKEIMQAIGKTMGATKALRHRAVLALRTMLGNKKYGV